MSLVTFGRLLGFIVSKEGIKVDPFKFYGILQLPPHIMSINFKVLKEKPNFLQRFIVNYTKITKGFMCLLKKGVPFIWDES